MKAAGIFSESSISNPFKKLQQSKLNPAMAVEDRSHPRKPITPGVLTDDAKQGTRKVLGT